MKEGSSRVEADKSVSEHIQGMRGKRKWLINNW